MKGPAQAPQSKPKSEAEKYRDKTETLEAQDNYLQTKDRIENPPSAREAQSKREADLEQRVTDAENRARTAEDTLRTATEDAKKAAEEEAKEARRAAEEARKALEDQRHQMLMDRLEDVTKSKKPLQEQFDEYFNFAEEMASKMGYAKPGMTTPATENPQIALEIARLKIEDSQRQREHDRQMEADKRNWDLRLEEIRDSREYNKAQLELQRDRDQALFQLPETLGAAILRGAYDREGRTTGTGAATQHRKTYTIQLGEGEQAEFACPHCQTAMAVGPTSTIGQCVGCNAKFPVVRVPVSQEPIPPEEK